MANSIFISPGIGNIQGGNVSFDGSVNASSGITTDASAAGTFNVTAAGTTWGAVSRSVFNSSADGMLKLLNNGGTVGVMLKTDALPTIGAGFGGSPSVVTGSSPLSGRIDVGTGGAAVTGTLTFGGTAFPANPAVVCSWSLGSGVTTAVGTVSGINFSTSVAWPTGCIISYHCISPSA